MMKLKKDSAFLVFIFTTYVVCYVRLWKYLWSCVFNVGCLSGYRFFEEMKVKDFIISFVSIALAMMFKSNYLIVFIAMVLFVLIDIIMNKHFSIDNSFNSFITSLFCLKYDSNHACSK